MNLFFSGLPLVLLIFMMTFRKGVPSHITLPVVATLVFGLQFFYFQQDSDQIYATVVAGFLTLWTPVLILWGALFLFKTMEESGSLDEIKKSLNQVSTHPVAQLMIIGWAFSFFVEGISGFGTPAALAAPLLLGFGFPALKVVLFCLALNTIPVTFGAVGTPIWFGFGELGLESSALREISFKTAMIQVFASLVIPVLALRFMISWELVRKNLLFIYISILATTLPFLAFSFLNTEFPSILGGLTGMGITVLFAKKGWGLNQNKDSSIKKNSSEQEAPQYFKAFFPLGAAVIILILTRIQELGLKSWLTQGGKWLEFSLGDFGNVFISSSFVLRLEDILTTTVSWKHPLLYIPSILPFGVVSLFSFLIFKMSFEKQKKVWSETMNRLANPFLALLGAMIFVKLLMLGGEKSPVLILGHALADISGIFWRWASVYMGALGSFFAGSATVSNLTFGAIQVALAERLGVSYTTVLALQAVGGAMGNMACIHNIVAVCAILGLQGEEGNVLKKIFPLLVLYGLVAGAVALLL